MSLGSKDPGWNLKSSSEVRDFFDDGLTLSDSQFPHGAIAAPGLSHRIILRVEYETAPKTYLTLKFKY